MLGRISLQARFTAYWYYQIIKVVAITRFKNMAVLQAITCEFWQIPENIHDSNFLGRWPAILILSLAILSVYGLKWIFSRSQVYSYFFNEISPQRDKSPLQDILIQSKFHDIVCKVEWLQKPVAW